jgi:hypothetical protein
MGLRQQLFLKFSKSKKQQQEMEFCFLKKKRNIQLLLWPGRERLINPASFWAMAFFMGREIPHTRRCTSPSIRYRKKETTTTTQKKRMKGTNNIF